MTRLKHSSIGHLLTAGFILLSQGLVAAEMPPKNAYLADSNYAMAHADPAQQDALPQAGPSGPSRILTSNEIQYVHTGPAYFGITTSGVYEDGKRVFWGNGLDRIVKLDYDTHEVVTEYAFPGQQIWSAEQAEQSIADFDDSNDGVFALYHAFLEGQKLRNLSNLYTVLDKDHDYYIGSKSGLITAYGDKDPSDSRSDIIKLREFQV
jgi:hypothetical protein